MIINWKKKYLASLCRIFFVYEIYNYILKIITGGNYIRVVNYHGVSDTSRFTEHLKFYARHYESVSLSELKQFLSNGHWTKSKPGLIISFDDGLLSNYSIAKPLLEEFGFEGWFFVPTDFISCAPDVQKKFAKENSIQFSKCPEERIAMSWDELKEMDKSHVVGSHTRTHKRLSANLSDSELQEEIIESKKILEEKLGHEVESFCWVGGEEDSYSRSASELISKAGYKVSFMTNSKIVSRHTHPLQIQRSNVEGPWDISIVKFQLSGIMDFLYRKKRTRVNSLTKVSNLGE